MNKLDDEYDEELLEHLLKIVRDIPKKLILTFEELLLIQDAWKKKYGDFLHFEIERKCLGLDIDGYILLMHMTPKNDNPNQKYFTLLRHPEFKKQGVSKYKVDFCDDGREEADDFNIDTVGYANNLLAISDLICDYWLAISDTKVIDKDTLLP